jgi:hypothetical protein
LANYFCIAFMFDNEVNNLFASLSAILAPAERDLLIATSRAASVLTPLPPVPAREFLRSHCGILPSRKGFLQPEHLGIHRFDRR